MQLRLPWDGTAGARGPRQLLIDGGPVSVEIVRHRRARRYVVRLDADGNVRLTVPRGASIAGGLRFAAAQAPWIARERLRHLERLAPWGDGTRVWYRGELIALRREGAIVVCGDVRLEVPRDLSVRACVERHWRALADQELPPRCRDLAVVCGLRVARVSVRNQRSRWGACSPRGVITLNWRLLQMPASVSDYVLFHELMHLRQPNHSRRFWREVDAVCPGWRDAERWLRRHGKEIL